MRDTLITNIETLVAAYGGHIPITVGRALKAIGLGHSDVSHIRRVVAERLNFTINTYDLVVQAFSDSWPANVAWPDGIDRPPPATGDGQQDDTAAA